MSATGRVGRRLHVCQLSWLALLLSGVLLCTGCICYRPIAAKSLPLPPRLLCPGTLHAETSQARIEEAFKEFTNREDVAVLLINQVGLPSLCHAVEAAGIAPCCQRTPAGLVGWALQCGSARWVMVMVS